MNVSSIGLCVSNTNFKSSENCTTCSEKKHHNTNAINMVTPAGWLGAGAIGTTIISGVTGMHRLHKLSAYVGAGAIAAHIGLIAANHRNHHNAQQHIDIAG